MILSNSEIAMVISQTYKWLAGRAIDCTDMIQQVQPDQYRIYDWGRAYHRATDYNH
jgi:hypothetical protein